MRQLVACSTLAVLLVVTGSSPQCEARPPAPYSQSQPQQHPWFRCEGNCTSILTDAIGVARKTILIEGSRIGPGPVRKALAQAEAEGVKVRAIIEHGRTRYPGTTIPPGYRGEIRDPNYAVDQPEVIVIDNRQVMKALFGSDGPHRSVTSLLVMRDPEFALAYTLPRTFQ